MALPNLTKEFSYTQVKLPSGKTIGVKGWVVRDEKELLFALETEENVEENKINHIINFLKTCVDDKGKFDTLSGNDLKKICIEARKLAKGDEITYTYTCPKCNNKIEDIINITESQKIKVFDGSPFKINENLIMTFKDVPFLTLQNIHKKFSNSLTKIGFYYLANSIESITLNGTTYTEFTEDEIVNFIDEMNPKEMEKLSKEFEKRIPSVELERKIKCFKCNEDINVEFGDLINFLIF